MLAWNELLTDLAWHEILHRHFRPLQNHKWITAKWLTHGKQLKEVAVWGTLKKTPSSRPILIYFEFRSKPSLVTLISVDPRPTNYWQQNIVFSYPEMIRVSFSLFLSLSVVCYFFINNKKPKEKEIKEKKLVSSPGMRKQYFVATLL